MRNINRHIFNTEKSSFPMLGLHRLDGFLTGLYFLYERKYCCMRLALLLLYTARFVVFFFQLVFSELLLHKLKLSKIEYPSFSCSSALSHVTLNTKRKRDYRGKYVPIVFLLYSILVQFG